MQNLLKIDPCQKLSGEVEISGSKNSTLPILAASLLSDDEITIQNIPDLTDISIMLDLLKDIGCSFSFNKKEKTLVLNKKNINDIYPEKINFEKAQKIRASSVLMGPLLVRKKYCIINDDGGGCNIGKRALDLHIKFLKTLGSDEIFDRNLNKSILRAEKNLFGNVDKIDFGERISVGATQNLIMASVLADGKTKISCAAREPEIIDLCNFLRKMGAKISGDGSSEIFIEGVSKLNGCVHEVMPDRIETGSYIICALMNQAEIFLKNTNSLYLQYFIEILKKTGAEFVLSNKENQGILIKKMKQRSKAISICTAPYPLFPTDLQQIYASYMSISEGYCLIKETLFENRFGSAFEMNDKLGAKISLKDLVSKNEIEIHGVPSLKINHDAKNPMTAFDLRGGMALICASFSHHLQFDDQNSSCFIKNFEYINRGYEDFIKKFEKIGGMIEIV